MNSVPFCSWGLFLEKNPGAYIKVDVILSPASDCWLHGALFPDISNRFRSVLAKEAESYDDDINHTNNPAGHIERDLGIRTVEQLLMRRIRRTLGFVEARFIAGGETHHRAGSFKIITFRLFACLTETLPSLAPRSDPWSPNAMAKAGSRIHYCCLQRAVVKPSPP